MKIFLKIILGIIGAAYFLVIASVTVCLLCYNDYKVTEIAGNSLIIIDKQSDKYKDGDLVVFKKPNLKNIKVGSEVFFYEVTNGIPSINYGNVTNIEQINEENSKKGVRISGTDMENKNDMENKDNMIKRTKITMKITQSKNQITLHKETTSSVPVGGKIDVSVSSNSAR